MKETPESGSLAESFAQERELAGYRYPLDETVAATKCGELVSLRFANVILALVTLRIRTRPCLRSGESERLALPTFSAPPPS